MNTELTIGLAFGIFVVLGGLAFLLNSSHRENFIVLPLVISFVIPLVLPWIFLSLYSFGASMDIEYWGSYITETRYYEAWNEKVDCRHEISCTHDKTCKDSNGRSYTCGKKHSNDGYQHSYDVDEHPPEWIGHNAIGEKFDYGNSVKFNDLCGIWKNKQRVELNRNYHTKDGNMYVCKYSGRPEELEPTTTAHTYENKIPVSDSYLRKDPPSPEEIKHYGLYPYPTIIGYYSQNNLLSPSFLQTDSNKYWLAYLNATRGSAKKIRIYVIVFLNKSEEAAYAQHAYWEGGNKNELIVCIGIDDHQKTQWAKAFSYQDNADLVTNIKYYLLNQERLDLVNFYGYLAGDIDKSWKRKEFSSVNKDLSVVYPMWYCFLVAIFSGIVAAAVSLGTETLDLIGSIFNKYR